MKKVIALVLLVLAAYAAEASFAGNSAFSSYSDAVAHTLSRLEAGEAAGK